MTTAVVLLSGGLDSATAMAMAIEQGRQAHPLSFDYGQKHERELLSAFAVSRHYGIEPRIIQVSNLKIASALTGEGDIPRGRDETRMAEDIPVTYVPARNSMFLAIAAGYAESIQADEIWVGFNAVDYSGYPDCRPEYVHMMERALGLGTKRGVEGNRVRIKAPIIDMPKVKVVEEAKRLGVPLHATWSCYVGGEAPCGECDSCVIRRNAFRALGCEDPALS